MNTTVLFDLPQKEIASLIRDKLSVCNSASIVTGYMTPSGIGALVAPIRARPEILSNLVVGSSTYAGFRALDQLIAWGLPVGRLRVHLGFTRESGTRKNPIVRHHPMLHSKVYYMELPDNQASAFVGSNNVTSFALQGLNGEASIMLEGHRDLPQFAAIRTHIQTCVDQSVHYSPSMKEAFAWWAGEFLDGLRAEIAIPKDWTTVRTVLILAAVAPQGQPVSGQQLYFELPAGIAIDSLKTEAHLFLFKSLPKDPWQALELAGDAEARYTCKVLGAENLQGNLEVKADWRINIQQTPTLQPVVSGIFRPTTSSGMQQVRADIVAPTVKSYDYLFERERVSWWPIFSNRDEIFPKGAPPEPFPITDTPWQKDTAKGWKLVTGLRQSEGPAEEKDAAALALAKPESGSFVLVSLRRREQGEKR